MKLHNIIGKLIVKLKNQSLWNFSMQLKIKINANLEDKCLWRLQAYKIVKPKLRNLVKYQRTPDGPWTDPGRTLDRPYSDSRQTFDWPFMDTRRTLDVFSTDPRRPLKRRWRSAKGESLCSPPVYSAECTRNCAWGLNEELPIAAKSRTNKVWIITLP